MPDRLASTPASQQVLHHTALLVFFSEIICSFPVVPALHSDNFYMEHSLQTMFQVLYLSSAHIVRILFIVLNRKLCPLFAVYFLFCQFCYQYVKKGILVQRCICEFLWHVTVMFGTVSIRINDVKVQ